jgi:hypothetical protein
MKDLKRSVTYWMMLSLLLITLAFPRTAQAQYAYSDAFYGDTFCWAIWCWDSRLKVWVYNEGGWEELD